MTSPNHFIASLARADYEAIAHLMEQVALERDDLINEAHTPLTHVYLPLNSILSVITVMTDGAQVESRTIGRESGHGLLHALGAAYSHERMVCQVGGDAIRIPLDQLRPIAASRPTLVRLIAEHAQATYAQMAQAVACNVMHPAHSRMARWLLMTQERLESDVLPLTQEHLSIMLGVQRSTVNPIAQHLQDKGLIAYSRGKIRIIDADGLHRQSCECLNALRRSVKASVGWPQNLATSSVDR